MKKLMILPILVMAIACGSKSSVVDLTGCYTSTLILVKDTDQAHPYTVHGHTFCASTNTWDSYHGVPDEEKLNIDEDRIVQFDDHTVVEQHFIGWAKPDWADIVDEVTITKDGLVTESFHYLVEYEGVVRTGDNG